MLVVFVITALAFSGGANTAFSKLDEVLSFASLFIIG